MRSLALPIVLLVAAACGGPKPATPRLAFLDEHFEALAVWRSARDAGLLAPGTVLVHLDAHEDMGVPDEEDAELTVSNFIVPALGEGIFSEVVWVVPPWLPEMPRTVKRAGFRMRIVKLADLPPIEGPVALDVDLDFFACENPHAAHEDVEITEEEFERLLDAGTERMRGVAVEGSRRTESIVLARPPGSFTWPVRLDRVSDAETGEVRCYRGFICMGEYDDEFPVRRPSEAEWRGLVREVAAALGRSGLRPSVITVARSAGSGFVPADLVNAIEEAVGQVLLDRWPAMRFAER